MLIVVAPSSRAIWRISAVNSASARVASIGENSTSSTNDFACATAARAPVLTSSRVARSWCSMWMSDVEMNVWMRGRAASRTAAAARSTSAVGAREPRDDGALHVARDRLHGLEVARRGDREAGLDDVHAEAGQLVRDLELLRGVERDARGLLAVAEGGVEDEDAL